MGIVCSKARVGLCIATCLGVIAPAVGQTAPYSSLSTNPLIRAEKSFRSLTGTSPIQPSSEETTSAFSGGGNGIGTQDQTDTAKTDKQASGTTSEEDNTEDDKDACTKTNEAKYTDCRGVFTSSFYIGLAIDTFAGDETLTYLNPGDSGKTHERAIGGFDFGYRLLGERMPGGKYREVASNADKIKGGTPCDASSGEDCKNIDWHPRNLWVIGETVHGVRSVDINCTENPDLPVCVKSLTGPANPGEQLYYILRNATSLEGFMGFRWEFLGLQQKAASPANLYLKAQAGFLSVAGAPGSALDVDRIALGATATKGRYQNSYLEVGFGRSDMFSTARRKRVKVDGYLQRSLSDMGKLSAVSLFAQLLVDTDLGHGSDAIQSYIGLNFDLGKLFSKPAADKAVGSNEKQ